MSKQDEAKEIIRIAAAQWAILLTPAHATPQLIVAVSPGK